jgi:hypothetical protein
VIAAGAGTTRAQAERHQRALSRALRDGGPLPDPDAVLVRRVGDQHYVCPVDLVLRAALKFRDLRDEHAEPVVAEMIPDPDTRRRLWSLARSRRAPHILDHAFGVPVAWYAAFVPEERRHHGPRVGRGPRTRFITRVHQAVSRVESAAASLAAVAPDDDLDALEELGEWLDRFVGAGLVELDYGPLAARLPASQDRAASDLATATAEALRGRLLEAAAALAAAHARWSTALEQPEHC